MMVSGYRPYRNTRGLENSKGAYLQIELEPWIAVVVVVAAATVFEYGLHSIDPTQQRVHSNEKTSRRDIWDFI